MQEAASASGIAPGKPPYSLAALIALALETSPEGRLPVSGIYGAIAARFPYYRLAEKGWQNSVRHHLSRRACFRKVPARRARQKGHDWQLDPAAPDRPRRRRRPPSPTPETPTTPAGPGPPTPRAGPPGPAPDAARLLRLPLPLPLAPPACACGAFPPFLPPPWSLPAACAACLPPPDGPTPPPPPRWSWPLELGLPRLPPGPAAALPPLPLPLPLPLLPAALLPRPAWGAPP